MNQYLFNVNNEERNNILDLHKKLYDGYAVRQTTPNEQPLYVQDFANDKKGITVTSNGNVGTYSNKIYMKESKNICSECGLYEDVCECGNMYEEENELDEIDLEKLEKGKKYKYSTPAFEDELEYEDEHEYPQGDKMYTFKGKKGHGHIMGGKHIEDFITDIDEDINDVAMAASEEDPELGLAMADIDEDIYDVSKKFPEKQSFDYVEGEMEEGLFDYFEDDYQAIHDYLNKKSKNYRDDSENNLVSKIKNKIKKGEEPQDAEWEDVDTEIKESFISQQKLIKEMFDRFKKFN